MTADLFHIIATIIRRLTRDCPSVGLATRYDKYERVTSEPQPFLFQRTIGQRTEVVVADSGPTSGVIVTSVSSAWMSEIVRRQARPRPAPTECHAAPRARSGPKVHSPRERDGCSVAGKARVRQYVSCISGPPGPNTGPEWSRHGGLGVRRGRCGLPRGASQRIWMLKTRRG